MGPYPTSGGRSRSGSWTLRVVYAPGKAATLNGGRRRRDVRGRGVRRAHRQPSLLFPNAFGYDEVAPWLERGSGCWDRQKAVTVRGTFLQNRDDPDSYYREAFTVV